jgi:LmbE family N-acetylglucosaminyl deacetylase
MKKIIFGIFAHPDDEAFGPSGTLLLETRAGSELHLITLTSGDAGVNPDNVDNLGEVRLQEWREGGRRMGALSMNYLEYKDGQLTNLSMIEIAKRLVELVRATITDTPSDAVIEFMSLDLNGLTGHIDHIVAARAACLAFYLLKKDDARFTRIRLNCIPRTLQPSYNTDWIYMEQGRSEREIDEVIDAREVYDDIVAIVHAHHTQRGDGETLIKNRGVDLGLDYFIIKT